MNSTGLLSLSLGATTAASTAVLQQSISPVLMTFVSAAVGAIFSYAVLKTTVQVLERDMNQMRRDMGQVYDLLRESSIKIARIEGELDRDK